MTFLSVPAGGNCLPAGSDGKVVFIEKVGAGDDACVIPASANPKMLVVANGRVTIKDPAVFTGVLYALNRQRDLTSPPDNGQREVVRIEGTAKVVGAVFVDGASGKVGIYPPQLKPVCTTVLGLPVCLLDTVLGVLGLQGVVDSITGQWSGPNVQYSAPVVNAVTTYGSSGTVSGTFRQITPNAG